MKKKFEIIESRLYAKTDYTSLLSTKRLMGFVLAYKELDDIFLSSGALCVFDAYEHSGVKPFLQKFPIAKCTPYFLSVPTSIGSRIAYAGLKFSNAEPDVWKLAIFEERDVLKLMQDSASVFNLIGSGIMCIGDYMMMREYDNLCSPDRDEHPVDRVAKFDGSTALNFTIDGKAAFSVFSSGWGDGNYSCYIGYDKNGNPVNIICDFNMIEIPKEQEDSKTVSFVFDINFEQMYQNDPRLSVEENNIAKWTLVIENKAEVDDAMLYKAYSRRGYSLHNLGKYEAALEDYYKALALCETMEKSMGYRSHEWSLYDNAGTINKELGNIDEAKRLFEKAKSVGDSFYSGAYINLIDIYIAEKNYEKAIQVANEMVENRPSDPQAYNKRAEIYVAVENFEKAIADYDILIEKFQWDEGILEKTSCLAAMLKYDEAVLCLEDYVVDNKPNDFYFYNKGFLEFKRKNYKKSYDCLLLAYEYNPEFLPALHLLIELDDLMLNYEKTAMWATRYIEIRPNTEFGYSIRAFSNMKLGNYDIAAKDYDVILDGLSQDTIYYRWLILAHIKKGDFLRAKKITKRLRKIDLSAYENAQGLIRLAKNKFASAEKPLLVALEKNECEEYYIDIIDYYIKIKNFAEAKENIAKLKSAIPDSSEAYLIEFELSKNEKSSAKHIADEYIDTFLPDLIDEEIIDKIKKKFE